MRRLTLIGASGDVLIRRSIHSGPMRIERIKGDINILTQKGAVDINGGNGMFRMDQIDGDVHLFAQHAPLQIISSGLMDWNIEGNFHLDAGFGKGEGNVSIHSIQPLILTVGKDLILSANIGNASLHSTNGVRLHVKNNLIMTGSEKGKATITGKGSSIITGKSLHLLSTASIDGQKGSLLITAGTDLILENPTFTQGPSIQAGQLNLNALASIILSEDSRIETEQGVNTISAGQSFFMDHMTTLLAQGGDLNITANQGNIQLDGQSSLIATTGNATLIAGRSIIFASQSSLSTSGDKGATLITNHLNDLGGFILERGASIETGSAPLNIFTAKRNQNSVEGKLNDQRLEPAPLELSTSEEKWGIAFSEPVDPTPSPIELLPLLVEEMPTLVESAPVLVEATPAPVASAPILVEATPAPVASAPILVEATPAPVTAAPILVEATPAPVTAAPVLVEATPAPVTAAPVLVEATPAPVASAPILVEATPTPVASAPVLVEATSLAVDPIYLDTIDSMPKPRSPSLPTAITKVTLPTFSKAAPFTIFYKEASTISRKSVTRTIINFIGPFTAELFRDLHPYDEFIKDRESFTIGDETYSIPRGNISFYKNH